MTENIKAASATKSKISLHGQHHKLADVHEQLDILEQSQHSNFIFTPFKQKLQRSGLYPLRPTGIEILQINVGKMCNQVCQHCHVDAGPDRKEIMTKETMQQCIDVLVNNPSIKTVDLTGGAPELNPGFRWFVEKINELERHIIVRCNLTIILANKKYHDLPEFFKEHSIEVVSSLPFYSKSRTDRQRGDGVFD
ncbi:MAG: radical SAM protein, partial [Ferruginibacter sp.]